MLTAEFEAKSVEDTAMKRKKTIYSINAVSHGNSSLKLLVSIAQFKKDRTWSQEAQAGRQNAIQC